MPSRVLCRLLILLLITVSAAVAAEVGPADEFDTFAGWTAGRVTPEVAGGKLILQAPPKGNCSLTRTFSVDVGKFPLMEVKIDESTEIYNIGYDAGQGRQVFCRNREPGVFRHSISVGLEPGVQEVKISLIFAPNNHFVLDYIRFLAPPPAEAVEAPEASKSLRPMPQATDGDRAVAWYGGTDALSYAVWKESGVLSGVWDGTTGERIATFSPDAYEIHTRESEEPDVFSESDDRVVEERVSADAIELTCENKGLPGITIKKTYRVGPFDDIVSKSVEFLPDGTKDYFLHWVSAVNLPEDFRAPGYYFNPDRHPRDYPYVYARDVLTKTRPAETYGVSDYHLMSLTNLEKDRTLGTYRYENNGEYVHPQTCSTAFPGTYYTGSGWTVGALVARPEAGGSISGVVHYRLVEGDQMDFHRAYQELPGFLAQRDYEVPAWVNEIKGGVSCGSIQNPAVNLARKQVEMTDSGILIHYYWVSFNISDYQTEGSWTPGGMSEAPVTDEMLREVLATCHAISPRIKLGQHAWYWSAAPDSDVYTKHPDWQVRNRDGKARADYAKFVPRLLTPEHKKWIADRTEAQMGEFNFDFFYIDGGQGGIMQPDWTTLRLAQDYNWRDMHRSLRSRPHNQPRGKNNAAFFNGTEGLYSLYNGMGYFEGFIAVRDWRALSDRLYLVKLYERPETWTSLLYMQPDNYRNYQNYCVLLGLKPHAVVGLTTLPLLNMAFELDDTMLSEVDVDPCWWKMKTELEAYMLEYGNCRLLGMINHDPKQGDYMVNFDPAGLGFDAGRPVYLYEVATRTASHTRRNLLSEGEHRKLYEKEGWAPVGLAGLRLLAQKKVSELGAQEVSLLPERTYFRLMTQQPALVWSQNGHRLYFPMSHTRWATVTGEVTAPTVSVSVDAKEPVEVAVLIPDGWTDYQVQLDGKEAAAKRVVGRFEIIAVPAGEHTVTLSRPVLGNVAQPTLPRVSARKVELPDTFYANSQTGLSVVFDRALPQAATAHVNIVWNDTPIYMSKLIPLTAGSKSFEHALTVPAQALPTNAEWRVGFDGIALEGGIISRPVKIEPEKVFYPEAWDSKAKARIAVEKNPGEIDGFPVLRTFRITPSYNDESATELNLKTKAVRAATGNTVTASYAASGLEFASLGTLRANLALYTPSTASFDIMDEAAAGYTLDYHTPSGYSKRACFYLTKTKPGLAAGDFPWWGVSGAQAAPGASVQYVNLREKLIVRSWTSVVWNLSRWAPDDWDGRVIVGVNVRMLTRNTDLFMRAFPEKRYAGGEGAVQGLRGLTEKWTNVSFLPLEPGTSGSGASARFNAEDMTFSARALATGYAHAGIEAQDMVIPRLKVEAKGNAALVVDFYDAAAGKYTRREIYVLSGDHANMARFVGPVRGMEPYPGNVSVTDLTGKVAAGEPFDLALSNRSPKGWQKRSRVRLVAAREGSATVKVLMNETFWRF